MRTLIVDDEDGIREGLASFLRHHGHTVHTAASCAEAQAVLAGAPVDVVVTDWRLTDGTAAPLVDRAPAVIVITGCPEEIVAGRARVLRKPVLPDALLAHIAALHTPPGAAPHARAEDTFEALPLDTKDRVRLVLALAGGGEDSLTDDGAFVTLEVPARDEVLDDVMRERLGGDWCAMAGCPSRWRWRCHRDGRPAGVQRVIGPHAAFPACGGFAVDLHGQEISLHALCELLDAVAAVRRSGRAVHLMNVPGHLRLGLELLDRGHELPMRACSGPRLPAVLRQLWN